MLAAAALQAALHSMLHAQDASSSWGVSAAAWAASGASRIALHSLKDFRHSFGAVTATLPKGEVRSAPRDHHAPAGGHPAARSHRPGALPDAEAGAAVHPAPGALGFFLACRPACAVLTRRLCLSCAPCASPGCDEGGWAACTRTALSFRRSAARRTAACLTSPSMHHSPQ